MQCRRLTAGQGLATLVSAIGLAGHASILLHQVGQRLVRPVGGANAGELVDDRHLISGALGLEFVDLVLLHVVVDGLEAILVSQFTGVVG